VHVNLLLNRGTRWLDVHSHLPHEGRVDLLVHRDLARLAVRIPEWAGYAKVRFTRSHRGETVEGHGRDPGTWIRQRFLLLGRARAGERITVTFPLSRRSTAETAMGQPFEATWRGDDVVGIRPAGATRPLYNGRRVWDRAPLREGALRAPENELVW